MSYCSLAHIFVAEEVSKKIDLKDKKKNLLPCKHEKPAMMFTACSCLEDCFAAKRKPKKSVDILAFG